MAIKTVTGTTSRPYVHVKIVLSQSCVITATGADAPLVTDITGDVTGAYTTTLWATNDLTPTGTFYTVTEYLGSTDNTFTIQVPQTAGPFPVSTILVTPTPTPAATGAVDSTVVHLANPETVTGIKTFTANPVFNANGIVDASINSLSASKLTGANGLPDAVLSADVATLAGIQTITGVKTYSAAPVFSVAPTFSLGANFPSSAGVVAMGSGDDVSWYVNGVAWEMTSQQGTAASPISTGTGPNIKVSRTESIPVSTMPGAIGSNNEGNAAIWASATGDVNNQAQVSALLGTAISKSTQPYGGGVDPDACAVQGFAAIQGAGVGRGIGAYFEGRRDTNTGTANGMEVRSNNQTATDDSYVSTSISPTTGIWITCGGQSGRLNGAAISVGLVTACQWDVGIGFTTIGGLSSVKTATIRDDTSAATSHLINGTHATAAIAIAAGSGPILVGETTAGLSSSLLELETGSTTRDPMLRLHGGSAAFGITIQNSSGAARIGAISNGVGNFLTASAAGDVIFQNTTAAKRILIGGTTIVVSVKNDNTLGFFAKAEVAQQATTGTATGFTAGAGTAVQDASTFTGGTGATAYRISDIVLALKNYGLMAA